MGGIWTHDRLISSTMYALFFVSSGTKTIFLVPEIMLQYRYTAPLSQL